MRKKYKKFALLLTLLGTTVGNVGLASATAIVTNPDEMQPVRNSFIVNPNAKLGVPKVTATAEKGATTFAVPVGDNVTNTFGGQFFGTNPQTQANYFLFRKTGLANTSPSVVVQWNNTDIKETDKVSSEYDGVVGTYNGRDLKLTVEYTGFVYKSVGELSPKNKNDKRIKKAKKSEKSGQAGTKLPQLTIASNPFEGYVSTNIGNAKRKMKFKYADNNEPVDFKGDSFISVNSLNSTDDIDHDWREFTSYSGQDSNKYYLTNDTTLKEYTNPITGKGNVIGGTPDKIQGKFEDALGADTFHRATVTFNIQGQDPEFTIGTMHDYVWDTLSSATNFPTLPLEPTKDVYNKGVQYV